MPFKSQAQRRKFAELLVKGEISKETYEEWNRETGSEKLPERVKPKYGMKRNGGAVPRAHLASIRMNSPFSPWMSDGRKIVQSRPLPRTYSSARHLVL